MRQFLKTTLIGGALFLLPLVVLTILLDHAVGWARRIVDPISKAAGFDQLGVVASRGAAWFLAVALVVTLAFVGGLLARTRRGADLSHWFETKFLGKLPQYRMAKSLIGGLGQIDNNAGLRPVLVSADDDSWQLGYFVEAISEDWIVVFVPQAPTPMSGNFTYVRAERVRSIAMTMAQAGQIVLQIGAGSAAGLGTFRLGGK